MGRGSAYLENVTGAFERDREVSILHELSLHDMPGKEAKIPWVI